MSFIPIYVLILAFTITIDFYAGIFIEKYHDKKRLWFLFASLCANIGILSFFKYYNFLNNNLTSIFGHLGHTNPIPHLNIILPIGLSFHTFQAMSYTIEVYRGNHKAERHFGIFALYVMFYPQLVAGPIERPQNLLHQFKEKHRFEYLNLVAGLRLILYGLFLKMVIADNLSDYVNTVYASPEKFNSLSIIIALSFYSFQIYCDFCGYSLIAIGSAKVMGFKLMNNFKTPYFSRSISEFWQRWHISLSTWFKDYLYIPLGGNRVKISRWMFNIFIVFAISGLWHGANWTFVIWGVLWGFLNILEYLFRKFIPIASHDEPFKLHHLINIFSMFIIATGLWVFFRSESIGKAKLIFESLLTNIHISDSFHVKTFMWVFIVFFLGFEILFNKHRIDKWFEPRSIYIRWAFYFFFIFVIIAFAGVENIPFIYFQF